AEPGKSPLALLAKTCETIGLPEGSGSKKSASSSPQERKDDASKIHHHHRSLMMDQQQSSTKQSSKSSPRSTPQSKEPTLTFPGLPKPSFPMGMPPMGFNPFFNPMMAAAAHYQMPMGFPGAFPVGPAGFAMGAAAAKGMPCPFAMMRQPCQNPACLQCPSSSNAAKNGQMSAEMVAQFAAHPLFSMYAGIMPGVLIKPLGSSKAGFAMGAAAANRMPCRFAMMRQPCQNPASLQCPSSSNAEKNGQMSAEMMAQIAAHPLFSMYAGMMQGVPTSSYQALLAASASAAAASAATSPTDYSINFQKIHAPPPSSSSTSSEPSTSSTGKAPRSSTTTPQRFNPYGKPVPTMVPPMGMNMNLLPFSLQAMYGSRLMPTVATHQ
ncbi:unnamed protein product, partial [Caenorhabditis brenneri]